MNNNGDLFVGNRKTSSATGEEITYDNPIPTITGEDPSRLSAVFDEVTIKERLVVEGGNSGTILSQFDGPVTFNKEVKFTGTINAKSQLKISDTTQSTTTANGALVVSGGVGIAKNLNVGGNATITGITTVTSLLDANGGATIDNVRIGVAGDNEIDTSTGNLTIDSDGGTVIIDDQLSVTGVSTFTGLLDANGGATIDNVRIGVAGDNEIDTSTGNLTIDSDGGTVIIDDNLTVSGITTLSSTLIVANNVTFQSDATIQGDLYVGKNGGGDSNIYFYNDSANTYGPTIQFVDTASTISASTVAADTFYFSNRIFVNGQIETNGDITAFSTSDQRLKDNITPIPDALSKVLSISGNTFDWNKKSEKEGNDVGIIAQEILEVLPEAVTTRDNGYLAVRYEKLIPLLIEAIKELKAEINELKGVK
jgi:hypothetical protein